MKPCFWGASLFKGRFSTTRSIPDLGTPVGTREKMRERLGTMGMRVEMKSVMVQRIPCATLAL